MYSPCHPRLWTLLGCEVREGLPVNPPNADGHLSTVSRVAGNGKDNRSFRRFESDYDQARPDSSVRHSVSWPAWLQLSMQIHDVQGPGKALVLDCADLEPEAQTPAWRHSGCHSRTFPRSALARRPVPYSDATWPRILPRCFNLWRRPEQAVGTNGVHRGKPAIWRHICLCRPPLGPSARGCPRDLHLSLRYVQVRDCASNGSRRTGEAWYLMRCHPV